MTIDQFLSRLATLTGWELRYTMAVIRRNIGDCEECPLTAVANTMSPKRFGLQSPSQAGLFIGLTSQDTGAIIVAAEYSGGTLRARLLEACKICQKSS